MSCVFSFLELWSWWCDENVAVLTSNLPKKGCHPGRVLKMLGEVLNSSELFRTPKNLLLYCKIFRKIFRKNLHK
jgi:hypothetical protein